MGGRERAHLATAPRWATEAFDPDEVLVPPGSMRDRRQLFWPAKVADTDQEERLGDRECAAFGRWRSGRTRRRLRPTARSRSHGNSGASFGRSRTSPMSSRHRDRAGASACGRLPTLQRAAQRWRKPSGRAGGTRRMGRSEAWSPHLRAHSASTWSEGRRNITRPRDHGRHLIRIQGPLLHLSGRALAVMQRIRELLERP